MSEQAWNQALASLRERVVPEETLANPLFFRRMVQVLRDCESGPGDQAKAVQDALRSAWSLGIENPCIEADLIGAPEGYLAKAGLRVDSLTRRVSWTPGGLPEDLEDVYRGAERRHLALAPMDEALKRTLRGACPDAYLGKGQQMAIRTVLTADPGSTVIVQLPTGSGKTLVIHALAASVRRDQLVMVLVPTTGLALEQNQRAREEFLKAGLNEGSVDVLHGGTTTAEREAIRERMDAGLQKLLFCTPESATGSLMAPLFRSARRGLLAALVVDEAHLIDAWGDAFRTEFQLLPALFKSLQEQSPAGIRKVLMSATFAPYVMQGLRVLFREQGHPWVEVNGNYLRPEISFHSLPVSDQINQERQVLNAVWQLPRPLILYVPTPKDADGWVDRLCAEGFNRTAAFHGNTPSGIRDEILGQWHRDELDLMVATSAFGVGMDKKDVRSVVHVMVPENLDRLYQDAGRGGRDGRASQSWVIWTERDLRRAQRINSTKLIGERLGLERWRALRNAARILANGHFSVDVSVRRVGIERPSEANQDWNWKTLLLQQRAGMVSLKFHPPDPPVGVEGQDVDPSAVEAYFNGYIHHVDVEVLDGGDLAPEAWDQKVGQRRAKEQRDRNRSFEALQTWIRDPQGRLCSCLVNFYGGDGREPDLACGGCPGCRARNRPPYTPTLGAMCKVDRTTWSEAPSTVWSAGRTIYVRYDPGKSPANALLRDWRPWILDLLRTRRIQAIRGNREVLRWIGESLPPGSTPFWCSLEGMEDEGSWPELVLVMPDRQDPTPILWADPPERERLIVAPDNRIHPRLPHRFWWESYPNCRHLEDFVRSI